MFVCVCVCFSLYHRKKKIGAFALSNFTPLLFLALLLIFAAHFAHAAAITATDITAAATTATGALALAATSLLSFLLCLLFGLLFRPVSRGDLLVALTAVASCARPESTLS
jgi:small-conductance mechanosensitive channel